MTDLPPKFKVSQTVLLTSQVAPQLNGVHVVRAINAYPDAIVDRTNQKFEGYSYELQGLPGDWAEHCLRAVN